MRHDKLRHSNIGCRRQETTIDVFSLLLILQKHFAFVLYIFIKAIIPTIKVFKAN